MKLLSSIFGSDCESMLTPEEADTLLTTHDLAEFVKEEVRLAGADKKISITLDDDALYLTSEGYTHGLSVTTDPFGFWVIDTLVSQENDGEYVCAGNSRTTEKTMTVIRAIARWIAGATQERQEIQRRPRFRLILERTVPG
jgi:glycine cleavage system aminomethyltransferase T